MHVRCHQAYTPVAPRWKAVSATNDSPAPRVGLPVAPPPPLPLALPGASWCADECGCTHAPPVPVAAALDPPTPKIPASPLSGCVAGRAMGNGMPADTTRHTPTHTPSNNTLYCAEAPQAALDIRSWQAMCDSRVCVCVCVCACVFQSAEQSIQTGDSPCVCVCVCVCVCARTPVVLSDMPLTGAATADPVCEGVASAGSRDCVAVWWFESLAAAPPAASGVCGPFETMSEGAPVPYVLALAPRCEYLHT